MERSKALRMPVRQGDGHEPSTDVDLEEKRTFINTIGSIAAVSEVDSTSALCLFRHEDLARTLENARPVDKTALTNILNHIHFMDGSLSVQLRRPEYSESLLIKVRPKPCLGTELTCDFVDQNFTGTDLTKYEFLNLIVDDNPSVIFVPAVLQRVGKNDFSVQLPEESFAVDQRQTKRHLSSGVDAELVKGGRVIKGKLLDFSAKGFRIGLSLMPSSAIYRSHKGILTLLHLRRDGCLLFSGLCSCIRQHESPSFTEIVLTPCDDQAKRSDRKQIRNPAGSIFATPVINFIHPFFGKVVEFDISDISTSGFSVYERLDEGLLIQGMIVPELTIEFAGALKIRCSAQVVYRLEEGDKGVRSGFAILDMDIDSYTRLVHILANSIDPYSRVSNKVDMDALWEFFFDTGFIYPKKYGLIQSQKETFKQTYQRLYNNNPEIARHFVYQKNGRLFAHISMVRAYERAWMIHHHAARSLEGKRAGFAVLKQIVLYLNDMHRLPSTKIDYMMVYFRPENKFPDSVFGGFARSRENVGVCSMDLFCYLPYTAIPLKTSLPNGWRLDECSEMNLWKLNLFYRRCSGGLFMDALGMVQKSHSEKFLEEAYGRLGFLRKWTAYSLEYQGELAAVLIVNQSDFGFNLSELLNGIQVLLINPEHVSWSILSTAIGQLLKEHRMEKVSILFFPSDDVKAKDIPFEKHYQLWIYDARFVDQFVQYMKRKFRIKDW
ncbi:MAG: hypothetical protein QG552_1189 [Thermodesulfobacteriota bacterium]|nr:hypothetical protein [Thermodesulfobacteriota bacterium]